MTGQRHLVCTRPSDTVADSAKQPVLVKRLRDAVRVAPRLLVHRYRRSLTAEDRAAERQVGDGVDSHVEYEPGGRLHEPLGAASLMPVVR